VLIHKIYQVRLGVPDEGERVILCAVVQRFQQPPEDVRFPWELWYVCVSLVAQTIIIFLQGGPLRY
jgi:hypothetical protein